MKAHRLRRNRKDTYLRNLVGNGEATHTRLTYHRTWETGLRVAIRVTAFSPAFFCPAVFPPSQDIVQACHPGCQAFSVSQFLALETARDSRRSLRDSVSISESAPLRG